ncbi:MAG: sigma-70 family RNA polymerase sigma factor [Anaerolineae bacterium]|nr:sigma-70 family RNA polymerase sigma factor [Anaerolineae bacterium]
MKTREAGWRCSTCGHAEGKGFNGLECPRCGTEVEGPVALDDDVDNGPDLDDVDIDNAVILYFREIDRVPLLTAEQEVLLAKQMEAGNEARQRLMTAEDLSSEERTQLEEASGTGEAARRHLTEANSRLVVSIAKRYMGQGVPFLDLIQEGNLGLMQAVERFDHRRGCRFSTYATWWIRQAVVRALAEQGRVVRLPAHANQQLRKLASITGHLRQELGREPTVEEIAERAETSLSKVRWAHEQWQSPLSLEDMTFHEDDEGGWADYIQDESEDNPTDVIEYGQLQQDLRQALHGLTAREERVLELRFGLKDGYSLKLMEVADRFGLTRERIRQIEGQALTKLRNPDRARRLREYLA